MDWGQGMGSQGSRPDMGHVLWLRPIPASPEFDLPKAARANAKKRRDEYARTHPNAPKNEASDIFEEENERSICMDNMVLDLQELEL